MTIADSDFRVGNLMTIDPVVIGPDAPASEAERLLKGTTLTRAAQLMVTRHIHRLVVVETSDSSST